MDNELWQQVQDWNNKFLGKPFSFEKYEEAIKVGLPVRSPEKPSIISSLLKDKKNNKEHYCCYCGNKIVFRSQLTQDHLIPLSKKGINHPLNKMECCKSCNLEKGSMMPDKFLLKLEAKYGSLSDTKDNRYILQRLKLKIELTKKIVEYVAENKSILMKQL